MSRASTAIISLNALRHNLSVVQQLAPRSKILAVIKANAYGHGMLTVASALENADAFAVAHIGEAETLRMRYTHKLIVLLQGFSDGAELNQLLALHITPVIHSLSQITLLEKKVLPNDVNVWLKVDTGMGRLGLPVSEMNEAWLRLNKIDKLQGKICVMSHFANADDPNNSFTEGQIELFGEITDELPAEKSLANSAGIIGWKTSHYQWVRPGIVLYGVSPFINQKASDLDLKPVMTLKSSIIAINQMKKSQTVGYGSRWKASEDTQIAVIACGYGDGYPRHIADNTNVLIDGQYYPIVGTVSMDMICINLGHSHQLKVGDSVTLWGEGLPVELIAEKAGTIAYELLCQVTSRVNFEVSKNGEN